MGWNRYLKAGGGNNGAAPQGWMYRQTFQFVDRSKRYGGVGQAALEGGLVHAGYQWFYQ